MHRGPTPLCKAFHFVKLKKKPLYHVSVKSKALDLVKISSQKINRFSFLKYT